MAEMLDDFNDHEDLMKERHGCVSAWLWLSFIGAVMSVLISIFGGDMLNEINVENGQPSMSQTYLYISALFTGVGAFAYYMILNWQKNGFYLASAISIVIGFVGYFMVGNFMSLAGAILGPIILFAILQIQKNGVSAWDHLE